MGHSPQPGLGRQSVEIQLGLGQDATRDGRTIGAQAAVFDLRDLTDPRRLDTVGFGRDTEFLASWDPRALTYLPETRTVLATLSEKLSVPPRALEQIEATERHPCRVALARLRKQEDRGNEVREAERCRTPHRRGGAESRSQHRLPARHPGSARVPARPWRIAARLRSARDSGEIRELDAALGDEVAAWAIMGANVFLGLRFAVWGAEDPDAVAEVTNSLLRRGLDPR